MSNGFGDPLVVRTPQLGAVLQVLLDQHNIEHSNDNGRGNFNNDQVTPAAWLSAASGITERRIWGIINNETKHTGLRVADDLLMVAGLPHLLQDGTIEVIPNPRMSQETWVERMQERGCY